MSIKNRTIAVVCGLALAATALAPAAAFADSTPTGNTPVEDSNTGLTEVTIEAKKDEGKDQLAFEVPTKIPFAAKADGTLLGPSAVETRIINRSVFPIHVTGMSVSAADGWSLVDDAWNCSDDNALSFKLNDVTAAPHADLSWNMGYKGSETASISIESEGKVASVTKDLSTPQKAATITWTLAAGIAPQQ